MRAARLQPVQELPPGTENLKPVDVWVEACFGLFLRSDLIYLSRY